MINEPAFDSRPDLGGDNISSLNNTVPVIGIGVYPGCGETVKSVCRLLPSSLCSALVLIQRHSRQEEHIHTEMLESDVEIREIRDGMHLQKGTLFVVPPGRRVQIDDFVFRLGEVSDEDTDSPIDDFFLHLAQRYGENSAAVVFPGKGVDGIRGIEQVDLRGGAVSVCSSEAAKRTSVPCSVRECGFEVMSPEEVADEICRISSQKHEWNGNSAGVLEKINQTVLFQTGIDISSYRQSVVQRRVRRRMSFRDTSTVKDYCSFLARSSTEADDLVSDFMIGVTSFFRDFSAWEVLRNRVLGHLAAEKTEDPVRIWTPGCATGEEAYSIAMLLQRELDAAGKKRAVQIFATDICEEFLRQGRTGRYTEENLEGLCEEYAADFFEHTDKREFTVCRGIRENVVFAKHNVLCDPPFSRMDLIICRNLLIYLKPEAQKRCLETFGYALKDEGVLFLGNAESINGSDPSFTPVETKKCRIYRRKNGARSARLPMHFTNTENVENGKTVRPGKNDHNLVFTVQKSLLESHGPAAVAVNRQYDIVYTSGPVNRFLCFPEGIPTYNLQQLLPESIRTRVRATFSRLQYENRDSIQIRFTEKGRRDIGLTVRRVGGSEDLCLLIFEELSESQNSGLKSDPENKAYVKQLQDELSATQNELQRHIEQLKTMNEELQSSNEELQASNEELETSGEELQSLNEELVTVNSQLQTKVEEQEETNNDLNNFLSSTEIPTLFLDDELRIRRFTPALKHLIGFISSDIGRSVRDFALERFGEDFLGDVQAVRGDLIPVKKEVLIGKNWFNRSVQPYRTCDDRIMGVVATFADITELKNAHDQIRAAADKFRIVADFTYDWEYWWTPDNRFVYITPSCRRVTGYSREEFMQDPQLYFRIVHPEDREKAVSHFLDDVRKEKRCESEFRIVRRDGVARWISHACQPVYDENGRFLGRRASNRDITERMQMEQNIRENRRDLKHAQQVARMGSWKMDVKENRLEWSEETYRIFGIAENAPVDYDFFLSAVHPEDRERVDAAWKKASNSGSYEVEHRIIADGRVKWVFEQAELTFAQNGELLSGFGTVQDITESVLVRQQIERAASLNEAVLQNLTEAVIVTGSDGTVLDVNAAALRMHGLSSPDEAWSHLDEYARTFEMFDEKNGIIPKPQWPTSRALRGEKVAGQMVQLYNRQTGYRMWLSFNVSSVVNEKGECNLLVFSIRDITKTKILERNLRENALYYRNLFENSNDAIGLIDCRTWKLVKINSKFDSLSGYSPQELIGFELKTTVSQRSSKRVEKFCSRVLKEKTGRMEMELLHKEGGRIPVDVNASLVEIDDKPFAVAVIRDISQRKKAEQQLRSRAEELAAMNRELESFSYSVSHDLRAPLRAITGFSSFLEEDYNDKLDETGRGYLKKVRENVHKMGALIDDLLSLSRVSRFELIRQEIDLGKMISSVVDELRQAEPDRVVELQIHKRLKTSGDARMLQIAVSNLVGNAWKFTRKVEKPRIEAGTVRIKGRKVFFLKDNGAGFDMKYNEKLFAPFQRLHADSDFSGTGIGLAIVERIVHRHGGRIWAESQEGKGATFYFSVD
ncbi:MAG: PAS domain S-box protein [Chitinispirillaceae bacterium]